MVKGVNLIPEDIQKQWKVRSMRAPLALGAGVYLAAMLLLFMSQRNIISKKTAEEASLLKERDAVAVRMASFGEVAGKAREARLAEEEVIRRLSAVSDFSGKAVSWSTLLKKLSHAVPREVWLKSLATVDPAQGAMAKRLRLIGSSTSSRGVGELMFSLENSGFLEDVTLSHSERRAQDALVYDFEIYASLKKDGLSLNDW